jgi:tRNA(adenine34) deaminase
VSGFARPGDERWMREALRQASLAADAGEVPVGACLVRGDTLIVSAGNAMRAERDATTHAELRVLRAGMATLGTDRLGGCTLYVTLEPCAMCAGALVLARVERVVFGAWDPKAGMAGSVADVLRHPKLNHQPEVAGGILADEAGALLSHFFSRRRSGPLAGTSVDPSAESA